MFTLLVGGFPYTGSQRLDLRELNESWREHLIARVPESHALQGPTDLVITVEIKLNWQCRAVSDQNFMNELLRVTNLENLLKHLNLDCNTLVSIYL
jgi:hypothetical protein